MKTLTFAAGTLEEECALMCSVVVCKLQLTGKYAWAAAPVLEIKCVLTCSLVVCKMQLVGENRLLLENNSEC